MDLEERKERRELARALEKERRDGTSNEPKFPKILLLGADLQTISERDEGIGREEMIVRRSGEVETDMLNGQHRFLIEQTSPGS